MTECEAPCPGPGSIEMKIFRILRPGLAVLALTLAFAPVAGLATPASRQSEARKVCVDEVVGVLHLAVADQVQAVPGRGHRASLCERQ